MFASNGDYIIHVRNISSLQNSRGKQHYSIPIFQNGPLYSPMRMLSLYPIRMRIPYQALPVYFLDTRGLCVHTSFNYILF